MEYQRLESSKGAQGAPPPQDSKARRRQATIASLSGVARIDSVASLMRRIYRSALECDTHALKLHLEEAQELIVSFELVRSLHMGKTIASLARCTDQSVASLADNIKRKWIQIARNGVARMKRLHPRASVSELLRGTSGGGIGFQSVDTTGIDPNFVLPKEIRAPRKSSSISSSRASGAASSAQVVDAAHVAGSSGERIAIVSIGGKRDRREPPDPTMAEPESGISEQLEGKPASEAQRRPSSSGPPAHGAGAAHTKSSIRGTVSIGAEGETRTPRVGKSTGYASYGASDGKDPRKKRRLEA